jgi:hypothetical protein
MRYSYLILVRQSLKSFRSSYSYAEMCLPSPQTLCNFLPSAWTCCNIRSIPLHMTSPQLLVGRHGMPRQGSAAVVVAATPFLWAWYWDRSRHKVSTFASQNMLRKLNKMQHHLHSLVRTMRSDGAHFEERNKTDNCIRAHHFCAT